MYVVKGGVEPHATRQICNLQAAFLLQGRLAHEERSPLRRVVDGVDTQTDVPECEVVIVETLYFGLHTVVVGQGAVVPVKALHLIDTRAKVDIRPTGYSMPHKGLHVEGVARQMDRYVSTCDAEAVGVDLPFHFRGGSIHSRRVAQGDVETGI